MSNDGSHPLVKWWLFALVTMLALPLPAGATLGGAMASIQADQEAMAASQKIIDINTVKVYELEVPGGILVKEYLSPTSTVFAIAWQGPTLPNLRQLLGDYFTQYTEGAKTHRGDHGQLAIQQGDLVVESSGRMRAFTGRAYLPGNVPQGFAVSDIQ